MVREPARAATLRCLSLTSGWGRPILPCGKPEEHMGKSCTMCAGSLRYPLWGSNEGDSALGLPGMHAQGGGDVAHAAQAKQSDH